MRVHEEDRVMSVRPAGGGTARPGRRCPHHSHIVLDGGPVLFRCEPYGHSVVAADISHEFTPPERSRAWW
jgi:hypothetical protein